VLIPGGSIDPDGGTGIAVVEATAVRRPRRQALGGEVARAEQAEAEIADGGGHGGGRIAGGASRRRCVGSREEERDAVRSSHRDRRRGPLRQGPRRERPLPRREAARGGGAA